jgi:hypothetical protein
MKTIAKDEFHDLLCRMADAATLKGKDMTPEPESDWVEYNPKDLTTHPAEGLLIETQFEDGSRRESTYSRAYGSFFSTPPPTAKLKCWRYIT